MEFDETPPEYHRIFLQKTVVPSDDLLWLRR